LNISGKIGPQLEDGSTKYRFEILHPQTFDLSPNGTRTGRDLDPSAIHALAAYLPLQRLGRTVQVGAAA
jgi:hypothetical protein